MIFVMNTILIDLLNTTAWRMETPQLFGAFHITASLLATALAVTAAVFFARRAVTEKGVLKILVSAGWVLVFLEVYKQLFLYFIVNERAYDFWFFPFQLCSVPMYLCILLPFLKEKSRVTLMTFMIGYTFISAVATLIYPEDILRPYISLTAHGFIWHGILLFISLFVVLSGRTDSSLNSLLNAAVLFLILSVIAIVINIAVEPVMPAIHASHPSVAHIWAAMFYMNPFHISPQPVISTIQKTAGIPAGLVLYMLAIAFVSSVFIKLFKAISRH